MTEMKRRALEYALKVVSIEVDKGDAGRREQLKRYEPDGNGYKLGDEVWGYRDELFATLTNT